MKYFVYISLIFLLFTKANAQTQQELKQHLIDGVEAFNAQAHESAASSFNSGSSLENYEDIAAYNRGRSLLETEDFESAISAFQQAIEFSDNPILKSRSEYNIGNASLMGGEIETAIEAYKSALKHDPNFVEARHNLANAYKLLQQQEEQEEEQDEEGEEGEQGEEGEEGEDNNEEAEESELPEENEEEGKPVDKQISKEEMERILENLENEEEKIQAKLTKQKGSGKKTIEKQW